MPTSLKRFAQPSIVIGATVVIALVAVVFAYFFTNRMPAETYVTPTMGPIVQEVDTTGTVNAADETDLGFQIGGKISYAGPTVGTQVAAGTTLGTLSSANLQASVAQAQAALQVQQANLAALQAGATPQTVAVAQTGVSNAQTAVSQAKQSVIQAAEDAYEKSDDAIHNKVDAFFDNPRTANPTLVFNLSNSQDQSSIISGRIQMETLLNGWQQYLAALPSDPDTVGVSALASTTLNNLNQVSSYLDLAASGLTEVIPTSAYPTATIQGFQASVATGRTNVSADISAMNAAQTAEKSAESGLASAQSQLALAQEPPTAPSIQAQEAQIGVAQANVAAAEAELAQAAITAPISGTITVNNMEPGEIAAPGTPEISMISDSQFQFDVYVSETDLAQLSMGQTAQVKLDAYQNDPPLSAHVIEIDPAATIQNGVSSYEVKLQFDQNNPEIQSGETGSVRIITQTEQNALSIPTSAIITNGTDHFVIKKTPSGDQQAQVQTGISSANGMTQITSGLSSTDQIRSFGNQ